MAAQRQQRLIWLVPPVVAISGVSFALLILFPGYFLDQHAHWILGCIQILISCGGLLYNIDSLVAWQESIVKKVMAELARGD